MSLEKVDVTGYRGFKNKQTINFSVQNGKTGSGLTLITGANNSGKSSIVEVLRARTGLHGQPPSFTVGTRNIFTDEVEISFQVNGTTEKIKSQKKGSSETDRLDVNDQFHVFCLPSRRAFNPFFGKGVSTRESYIRSSGLPHLRHSMLSGFESRLFNILKNQDEFNSILGNVLGYTPEWSIDQSDQGQYFLKFFNGGSSHTSDGLGEGIISIFSIVDSLYDSKTDQMVVIDEPELSLHPSLQKRLSSVINGFAKDRQIVISTHSPYFVDMDSICNGASLIRVTNEGEGTKVFHLTGESREVIRKLSSGNLNNPHTFGLDARELFFLEDKVVIVEGQEDVLLFPEVGEQVSQKIRGNFFGWGAGGASNIPLICTVLKDLGFRKVVGLLDGDKKDDIPNLKTWFPKYYFNHISADDIRTKPARKGSEAVYGLLDEGKKIRKEFVTPTRALFSEINKYLET